MYRILFYENAIFTQCNKKLLLRNDLDSLASSCHLKQVLLQTPPEKNHFLKKIFQENMTVLN